MNVKDKIINQEGYIIYESFVPELLCADFLDLTKKLKTVRAINKKEYKEREDAESIDASVTWSEMVHQFPEFQSIKRLVDPVIKQNFIDLEFYASDVVTVKAGSQFVNPHIDTPHRFKKWNYDKRLLGIQCIIPIEHTTKNNASTGLVPFSQKRDFDIDECYNGTFDRWFSSNCKQHDMPRGSLLFYNCRVLHSSMPNNTDKDRPALLLNYLDRNIIDEVKEVDNIWESNGKRS